MKNKISQLALMLLITTLFACGGGDNSIRVITQGVVRETDIQQTICAVELSGGANGSPIFAPIRCTMQFRTDGFFTDTFQFVISDARLAYEQRGQDMIIGSGVISSGYLTINQQEQSLISGIIRLSQVTNVVGGRIAGEFLVQTPFDSVEGHFNTKVVVR